MYQKRTVTPPPNTYEPSFGLIEKKNFNKISFGFGKRASIYGKIDENPGPGAYDIPSTFRPVSGNGSSRCSSPLEYNRAKTPRY